MEIELKLTLDDVNAMMQVLGQVPTSAGVWPLMMKIKQQAEGQLPKNDK